MDKNNIIKLIMDGMVEQHKNKKYPISGKPYIHWLNHAPRNETKARALAAAEASISLPSEIKAKLSYEELKELGIKALHCLGWPPKCYDDQGDVYILFADGHREYTGEIYKVRIRK